MFLTQTGGSNSLRGGKKCYGAKTKCGNWVELNKEPGQPLPSGFPHTMYETDAHQQMLCGLLRRPRKYGAGLPPPEDSAMDYSRVLNYDKRQQDSNWATITSTEFVPPDDGGEKSPEFASSFKMTGGITDPIELKQYRDTWTVETECVRPVRFKTDYVLSANSGVPPKFKMIQTRPVPGAPKAVERLRRKLQEISRGQTSSKNGLVNLRRALITAGAGLSSETSADAPTMVSASSGGGVGDKARLVEGLQSVGITVDGADMDRAARFFGTAHGGNGLACVPTLLKSLRGPLSECRREAVLGAFQDLRNATSGVIGTEDLRQRLESFWSRHEEGGAESGSTAADNLDALLQNVDLYTEGGVMTEAAFEDFLGDAFFAVEDDEAVVAAVKSLFGSSS